MMALRFSSQGRWLSLAILTILCVFIPADAASEELLAGKPIEQVLEPNSVETYDVALNAGEFLHLSVEQLELEVSATLFALDGTRLIAASGPGAPGATLPSFTISFVAPAAGRYRLEFRPGAGSRTNVRYRVRLDPPRAATSEDERVAAACRTFHEANQLAQQARLAPEAQRQDYFRRSVQPYRQAFEQFTLLGDLEGKAGALASLGWTYSRINELEESEHSLNLAAQAWRELGNVRMETGILLLTSILGEQRGHLNNALAKANDALTLARKLSDSALQRSALTRLAAISNNLGNLADGINYQKQLLDLEPSPDTDAAARYLGNIAVGYFRLNEKRTSIAYRERSAAIYRAKDRTKELIDTLDWIALMYSQLGDNLTARRYTEQIVKLGGTDDWRVEEASGDYARAIQIVRDAISRSHQQNAYRDEAAAWWWLSGLYQRSNRLNEAKEALDHALPAWTQPKDPQYIEFLASIAGAYQGLGLHQRALDLFKEYLNAILLRGVEGYPQYPVFLSTMAKTERDLGLLDDARRHLETAISIRENDRARIASPQLRASYFSPSRRIYDIYIDVLMHQHARAPQEGHDIEAFEASERARANGLMAGLGDVAAQIREGIDSKLTQRERSLEDRINELAISQRQGRSVGSEIQRLTGDLELLRGEIRRASPRYAVLTEPAPLNLREIRTQLLAPGTTLLEYALNPEGNSYVWVITNDSLHGFPLPAQPVIEKAARRVHELLTARQQKPEDEYLKAATDLSDLILRPVANFIQGQRLLVVADGALASVPFTALPHAKTHQPLVASHEIVRLPSASALAVLREAVAARGAAPNRSVAVLADPVFDATDERLVAARNTNKPGYPELLERALHEMDGPLPRLAFSRREAEAIKSAAPAGSVSLNLDFNANRAFATSSALNKYRIVHFATHGFVNNDAPELSGIVLSLVDRQGKPQDGFLRLHEIYNLHLAADLVVLSACQTAVGNELSGEGVIGLSRGFLYAGAARVMASLWTVDDRATAELMGRFYRKLLSEHMTPSAALRSAQLEMRQLPRWSSPYFWAAFELQGEWK
jgi:CHAT domain-containing protein/tetratricopeptide (TPR) repeat protein